MEILLGLAGLCVGAGIATIAAAVLRARQAEREDLWRHAGRELGTEREADQTSARADLAPAARPPSAPPPVDASAPADERLFGDQAGTFEPSIAEEAERWLQDH